jgi:ornithine cyclodeaminase
VVEKADIIVTNLRESVMSEKQGDLYEPIEKGLIKLEDIGELGELALGQISGRDNDEQITYHKNNNGTAASEIAIAMLVYERAKELGRGTMVDLIDPEVLKTQFAK